jgi:cell division protein FtsW (lipid II flippase)
MSNREAVEEAKKTNTVYWACTAGAFLWMAFALSTSNRPDLGMAVLIGGIITVPLWLIGGAVRYVVSSR